MPTLAALADENDALFFGTLSPSTRQQLMTILQCAEDSYSGARNFGSIVGTLVGAGVESYFADYRAAVTTYYMPNGSTHAVPLRTPRRGARGAFSRLGLSIRP